MQKVIEELVAEFGGWCAVTDHPRSEEPEEVTGWWGGGGMRRTIHRGQRFNFPALLQYTIAQTDNGVDSELEAWYGF